MQRAGGGARESKAGDSIAREKEDGPRRWIPFQAGEVNSIGGEEAKAIRRKSKANTH